MELETEKQQKNNRLPPYNMDAEQTVLGAILANNDALNRIGDLLRPEHFYEPVHGDIYEAILNLQERALVATPVTLKAQFDEDERLKEEGGAHYLNRLANLSASTVAVRDYAHLVRNLAASRQLISIGGEMIDSSYASNGHDEASKQIEEVEQKLFRLATEGESQSSFAHIKGATSNVLELAQKAYNGAGVHGTPTGFTDLDRLLGGFHNSDLIILAARPSMGKTAFALNLAMNAAEYFTREDEKEAKKATQEGREEPQKRSVGFVSLEMSSEQLVTRLISMETSISAHNIRRGNLERSKNNDEFAKLVKAQTKLHSLPLYIDDTPALSVSAFRARSRRLKRKHGLAFLVVDYLQLMQGTSRKAQDSRVQEISEITMGLKAIAKELDIPVLALSQLSRQVENREDKRPQLADLRESGSIEQDADMVMFIYREAYYIERKKPTEGTEKFSAWQEQMEQVNNLCEIMVAKNRNGPINNVTLFFDNSTTRFKDYDTHEYEM